MQLLRPHQREVLLAGGSLGYLLTLILIPWVKDERILVIIAALSSIAINGGIYYELRKGISRLKQNPYLRVKKAISFGTGLFVIYGTVGMFLLWLESYVIHDYYSAEYTLQIVVGLGTLIAVVPFFESMLNSSPQWLPEQPLQRGLVRLFNILKPGRSAGRQANAALSLYGMGITAILLINVGILGGKGGAVETAIFLVLIIGTAGIFATAFELREFKHIQRGKTKENESKKKSEGKKKKEWISSIRQIMNDPRRYPQIGTIIGGTYIFLLLVICGGLWVAYPIGVIYLLSLLMGGVLLLSNLILLEIRYKTILYLQSVSFWASLPMTIMAPLAGMGISGLILGITQFGNIFGLENPLGFQIATSIILGIMVLGYLRLFHDTESMTPSPQGIKKLLLNAAKIHNTAFLVRQIADYRLDIREWALTLLRRQPLVYLTADQEAIEHLKDLSRDEYAAYRIHLWPYLLEIIKDSSVVRTAIMPIAMTHCSSEERITRYFAFQFVEKVVELEKEWLPEVITLIHELGNEPLAEVRLGAAKLLSKIIRFEEVVPRELIDQIGYFLLDPSWDVRNAASEALEIAIKRDPALVDTAIDRVIDLFYQTEFLLHAAAVTSLGRVLRVDPKQAIKTVPLIEQMVKSEDKDTRSKAADAIKEIIGANPQIASKLTDAITVLSVDPQYEVRSAIAYSLVTLLDTHPEQLLDFQKAIGHLCQDPNAEIRNKILSKVSAVFSSHPRYIEETKDLILVLANSADPQVRGAAIRALAIGARHSPEVQTLLGSFLLNLDEETSSFVLQEVSKAILVLQTVNPEWGKKLIHLALELTDHPLYSVRLHALRAVSKIIEKERAKTTAIATMIKKLADDEDYEVRHTLLQLIEKVIGDDEWYELLEKGKDEDELNKHTLSLAVLMLLADEEEHIVNAAIQVAKTRDQEFIAEIEKRAIELSKVDDSGSKIMVLNALPAMNQLMSLSLELINFLAKSLFAHYFAIRDAAHKASLVILSEGEGPREYQIKIGRTWTEEIQKQWKQSRDDGKQHVIFTFHRLYKQGTFLSKSQLLELIEELLLQTPKGKTRQLLEAVKMEIQTEKLQNEEMFQVEEKDVLGLPLKGYKKELTYEEKYPEEDDEEDFLIIENDDIEDDPTVYVFDEVEEYYEDEEDYEDEEEDYEDEEEDYEDEEEDYEDDEDCGD